MQTYAHCKQLLSWPELMQDNKVSIKTGGLGSLLEVNAYESWLCVEDHACGDPWFCFVYHETMDVFTPWGTNSDLRLFKEL